ncbi:MAG: hypothetical protein R2880_19585 [Deinococcales bacterium]
MDVGSVKAPIVQEIEALGLNFSGHTSDGGQRKGWVKHASAALLETAMWVMTLMDNTQPETLAKLKPLSPVWMPIRSSYLQKSMTNWWQR